MPVHKIPRARLFEDLKALERDHEYPVTITADDDVFIVTTQYCGEYEYRRMLSVRDTVAEHRYAGGER